MRCKTVNTAHNALEMLCSAVPTESIVTHRAKAAEFYSIKESEVTPEQREVGKRLNYIDLYESMK
jgi:DNA polymerase I-like protein with 3'-5' exonuclease and polymerase domains